MAAGPVICFMTRQNIYFLSKNEVRTGILLILFFQFQAKIKIIKYTAYYILRFSGGSVNIAPQANFFRINCYIFKYFGPFLGSSCGDHDPGSPSGSATDLKGA